MHKTSIQNHELTILLWRFVYNISIWIWSFLVFECHLFTRYPSSRRSANQLIFFIIKVCTARLRVAAIDPILRMYAPRDRVARPSSLIWWIAIDEYFLSSNNLPWGFTQAKSCQSDGWRVGDEGRRDRESSVGKYIFIQPCIRLRLINKFTRTYSDYEVWWRYGLFLLRHFLHFHLF